MPTQLVVVASAVMHGALVCSLPKPARHNHVLDAMRATGARPPREDGVQGFLLSDGTFADRKRAMVVARAAGQLIPRAGGYAEGEINNGTELFSEDVW